MRLIYFFLICLFSSSLSAEMIGNVEYNLPAQKQNWEIRSEIKNDKGTTLIYVPEDASPDNIEELFAVHANPFSTGPVDQTAIEKILQKQYPDKKITVTILKQDPQSLIYEWSINDDGHEIAIGWSRIFSGPNSTVLLNYQSKSLENVDQIRGLWLPVLENAVVKN